jgi:hypothetical protein
LKKAGEKQSGGTKKLKRGERGAKATEACKKPGKAAEKQF